VGKVKKSGTVTDVRTTSDRRPAGKARKASHPAPTSARHKAAPGDRGRRKVAGGRRALVKGRTQESEISFRVRELDPRVKCGPGTSVQQLYRVDERGDGTSRVHLVFFDRHGWYCEHARDCPAVIHAKRIGSKRKPLDGHNTGRTRA
jgi:hypothetical protein